MTILRAYYALTGTVILLLILEIFSILLYPQINVYVMSLANDGKHIWNKASATRTISLNERGEYGELFSYDDPGENTLRIIQLGSSIATFTNGALGKTLKAKGRKVELIDCTVPGTNIINSFYVYVERCSKYKGVDYVVLQTTTSVESASGFLFPMEIPVQDFNIHHILFMSGNGIGEKFGRGKISRDAYGFLTRDYPPEVFALVNSLNRPNNFFYDWSNLAKLNENRSISKRVITRDASPEEVKRAAAYGERILRKLAEETQKNSSKLIIANIPTQLYLHHFKLSAGLPDKEVPGNELVLYSRNKVAEKKNYQVVAGTLSQFKTALSSAGVEFIDLAGPFSRFESGDLYGRDNYHLGPEGIRIAFGVIAERMVE